MTGRALPSSVNICSSLFVRGDSARSTSGTGLGLAIVQRIIDNHNGCWRLAPASVADCRSRARATGSVARVRGDDKEA